jgi:hypothetical protein
VCFAAARIGAGKPPKAIKPSRAPDLGRFAARPLSRTTTRLPKGDAGSRPASAAVQKPTRSSYFGVLGEVERIFDVYAEVTHRALDLGVTEQEPDPDDIAAPQLAVDRKVEQGSMSKPSLVIKQRPYRPDLLRPAQSVVGRLGWVGSGHRTVNRHIGSNSRKRCTGSIGTVVAARALQPID